jgi:hypothetical protein
VKGVKRGGHNMNNHTVPSNTLELSESKYSNFSAEEALKGELNKLQQQPPTTPPATTPTITELVTLSRLDPAKQVEEPPIAGEIHSNGIASIFATLGNFSLIIGKAKSRKTFFISLLVSAFLVNRLIMDKLQGHLKNGKNRVIVFDTEQATYHAQKVYHRILQTAGLSEAPALDFHCLRTYDTATRLKIIEHVIYNTPGLGVVVIDGIRDLVLDINSAEEASMITNKLLKWTEEKSIHIITVLHQNKADNNARGHVGTELINKAESVLSVAKDSSNPELSIVTPEYFRGKDFEPFAFSVDPNGLPYIVDDYSPEKAREEGRKSLNANNIPDEQHRQILMEVFTQTARPKYRDLQTQVKLGFQVFGVKCGDNKAGEFITYYKNKGWVKENEDKLPQERFTTYHFS